MNHLVPSSPPPVPEAQAERPRGQDRHLSVPVRDLRLPIILVSLLVGGVILYAARPVLMPMGAGVAAHVFPGAGRRLSRASSTRTRRAGAGRRRPHVHGTGRYHLGHSPAVREPEQRDPSVSHQPQAQDCRCSRGWEGGRARAGTKRGEGS
jgi:hypothetical protein